MYEAQVDSHPRQMKPFLEHIFDEIKRQVAPRFQSTTGHKQETGIYGLPYKVEDSARHSGPRNLRGQSTQMSFEALIQQHLPPSESVRPRCLLCYSLSKDICKISTDPMATWQAARLYRLDVWAWRCCADGLGRLERIFEMVTLSWMHSSRYEELSCWCHSYVLELYEGRAIHSTCCNATPGVSTKSIQRMGSSTG